MTIESLVPARDSAGVVAVWPEGLGPIRITLLYMHVAQKEQSPGLLSAN